MTSLVLPNLPINFLNRGVARKEGSGTLPLSGGFLDFYLHTVFRFARNQRPPSKQLVHEMIYETFPRNDYATSIYRCRL